MSLNSLLYKRIKTIVSSPSFKSGRLYSTASTALRHQQQCSFDENMGTPTINERIGLSEILHAKVSILIVVVVILCHTVRWVPNIYELIQRIYAEGACIKWPVWVESLTHISHFLTVVSCSLNFYIYYLTHYGLPFNRRLAQNQHTKSDMELQNV